MSQPTHLDQNYIENNIETKITDDNLFMIDVFLSLKTNQGKICLRKKLVYNTYNLDFKNKDEATKIKSNFYYEIEYME